MADVKGKNIAVAMSGGVDSSVAAARLKAQGARVQGVFMGLAQPDLATQTERVRNVADFLDIPLAVVDLGEVFQKEVLDYFCDSYVSGRTPNPCVVCNRQVKCGALLAYARNELGAELLATGHYARLATGPAAGLRLLKGLDPKKDQSYFLCRLGQEQLAHLCFPLGELTKEAVYGLARDLGLAFEQKEESQDVCFLENQSVAAFLDTFRPASGTPGPIVTLDGREVGRHQGITAFTVGQRRGLGIPDATPYYVVGLDPQRNAVIVGKDADLWHTGMLVRDLQWQGSAPPALPLECMVKIRYRHQAAAARVVAMENGQGLVNFAAPQRAITPGQFAVFYDGEAVAGSGIIVKAGAGA